MRAVHLGAIILAMLVAPTTRCWAADAMRPTIQSITAKYGRPDKIISNEFERPRVKSVSKSLLYKKQAVKFVFVPDAPESAPPPYKNWKFAAVRDANSDTALAEAEAEARMKPRLLAQRAQAKPEAGSQPQPAGR